MNTTGQYVTSLTTVTLLTKCQFNAYLVIANIAFSFFLFVVNRVGCIYTNGAMMKLQCNNSQHIQVVNATIGQSSEACHNNRRCCSSVDDYRYQESTQDVKYLKDRCDGRQTCNVWVRQLSEIDTDYESVNYICRNDPTGKHTLCILTMKMINIC